MHVAHHQHIPCQPSDAALREGASLGLSVPRDAYLRRHPPTPSPEDLRWRRRLRAEPEPLSETEQERIVRAVESDPRFGAALRAALEGTP